MEEFTTDFSYMESSCHAFYVWFIDVCSYSISFSEIHFLGDRTPHLSASSPSMHPSKEQALVKPNHSWLPKPPCSVRLPCICTRGVPHPWSPEHPCPEVSNPPSYFSPKISAPASALQGLPPPSSPSGTRTWLCLPAWCGHGSVMLEAHDSSPFTPTQVQSSEHRPQ